MPLDQPDEKDPAYAVDYDHGDPTATDHYKLAPFDKTMPLGDHLEELRSRMIKMLAGIVIALVFTVFYSFQIIGWIAQPLLHVQDMIGVPSPPIQTDPTAGFTSVYMPVVLVSAVIVAAPWIIWQAWQFIVLGLYEHEKKAVHILAPFSTFMTALAVMFTYYILLPVSLAFFINFVTFYPEVDLTSEAPIVTQWVLNPYITKHERVYPEGFVFDTEPLQLPILEARPENPKTGQIWINSDLGRVEMFFDDELRVIAQRSNKLITPLPAMNEYIRFAVFMMLGNVIAFQLPVIMLVLGWAQIFDPRGIASLRKYALFGSCVLGAVLTPSDPLSMVVLAVPLYLLFELGLLLMNVTYKKTGDQPPLSDET